MNNLYRIEPYKHDYHSEEDCKVADPAEAHFWRVSKVKPEQERATAGMASDYQTWVADFSEKGAAGEYVSLKGGQVISRSDMEEIISNAHRRRS